MVYFCRLPTFNVKYLAYFKKKIIQTLLFIKAFKHWISLCWFLLSMVSWLWRTTKQFWLIPTTDNIKMSLRWKHVRLTASCPTASPESPAEDQDPHDQSCSPNCKIKKKSQNKNQRYTIGELSVHFNKQFSLSLILSQKCFKMRVSVTIAQKTTPSLCP